MPFFDKPIIFGHRGCPRIAPENTLASFREIKNRKISGVELDVQLSADGKVMVFHDFTLNRVCGESGILTEWDAADLRTLDAGSSFSEEFKGEKMPFLQEVFELLADEETLFDIELKTNGLNTHDLCREVWQLILGFGLEKRCLITSFNPKALRDFSKLKSGLPQAVIYADDIPWYLRRGQGRFLASSPVIKPGVKLLTPELIHRFREKEKREIFPWCVDTKEKALELMNQGISVISNVPYELL